MKRMRLPAIAAALFFLTFLAARPPDAAAGPSVATLLRKYFEAESDSEREKALKKLKSQKLSSVEAALSKWKKYKKVKASDNEYRLKLSGSDEAVFYVPEGYNGKKPYGLIVHLYGAGGYGRAGGMRWAGVIGKKKYFAMSPHRPRGSHGGRVIGDSEWWNTPLAEFTKQCIDAAMEKFNIDPDQVYLSGFSNGAHGTWSVASFWPDRIAGVTAHCGAPTPQLVDGRPMYLENLLHVPMDLRMGGKDRQPWKFVKEVAGVLKESGADVKFTLDENWQHRWMKDKAPDILKWFGKKKRALYPKQVNLRAKDLKFGKAYWLRIDETGDCGKNGTFKNDYTRRVQTRIAGMTRIRSPFPIDVARLEAKIEKDNAISIIAYKVKKLTVFLHPKMGIKLAEPVRISVNGEEIFSGKVIENVETLAGHARVYNDTGRAFTAAVAIDLEAGAGKAFKGTEPPKIEKPAGEKENTEEKKDEKD